METGDSLLYPTREHEGAAGYATDFLKRQKRVDAVLLTCSCARGKAVPGSCVDISVLLHPSVEPAEREQVQTAWSEHSEGSSVLAALARHGRYAHVDVDMADGEFAEGYHGWCSGPDEFELEIGNLLQYSVPLWENGDRLAQLKEMWLPYYGAEWRARRLAMVRKYCLNNIDHVAPYVERELFFQGFRRLYHATGEFLQALFIAHRVYPIAYDKWVKEQLTEILGDSELYAQFVELLSMSQFESDEMSRKAEVLRGLVDEHCTEDSPGGSSRRCAERSDSGQVGAATSGSGSAG